MVRPLTSFQAPDVVVDVAGEINLKVVAPVGPEGENGRTILNGTIPPQNSQGVDGDFYLNTTSWLLYGPKANDTWAAGVSLIGAAGEDGIDGINASMAARCSAGPVLPRAIKATTAISSLIDLPRSSTDRRTAASGREDNRLSALLEPTASTAARSSTGLERHRTQPVRPTTSISTHLA
jgi:hypothetical protein